VKAKQKLYDQTSERKAYLKEYYERPEVKERERKRSQTPERKAYMKEYMKALYQRKKHPILDMFSGAIL